MFNVRTRWVLPEVVPGQPQRPIPDPGAYLSYRIDGNVLRIENLEDRLSGVFLCEYDVTTGALINSGNTGNCDNELMRVVALIDAYLSEQQ